MDSSFYYVSKIFNHNFILEKYAQGDTELFFIICPGQTHGNSLTLMDGQVSHSEGTSVTMNCTYSASGYPALFWYVQYPGEDPQLLLKPRRPMTREPTKVLKPHIIQKLLPSTWRKPQCKSQTRLCTTVLWVTQWWKLQGELSTNSEQQWGLDAESLIPSGPSRVYGGLSLSLWLIQKSYQCLEQKDKK